MSVKILFVISDRLPHPTGSGASVLWMGFVRSLQQLGFQPVVVAHDLVYSNAQDFKFHRAYLKQIGVNVIMSPLVMVGTQKNFFQKCVRLFIRFLFQKINLIGFGLKICFYIDNSNIKIVVACGLSAVHFASQFKNIYKIASIVDLPTDHENLKNNLVHIKGAKNPLWNRYQSWKNNRKYKKLSCFNYIIEHAHKEACLLKKEGFENVIYLPHPIPIPQWSKFYSEETENSKIFKILIPGSLKGSSSLLGFNFFIQEILPRFIARMEKESIRCKFKIVGHGFLPKLIEERLRTFSCVEIGYYAKNMDEEYLSADLILVNVPVPVGFRTRIAEAFSYGICVVAHAANCSGMPEIKNGFNALISEKPEQIANDIIRFILDPSLRKKIGINAYQTFLENYSVNLFAKKLKRIIPSEFLPC